MKRRNKRLLIICSSALAIIIIALVVFVFLFLNRNDDGDNFDTGDSSDGNLSGDSADNGNNEPENEGDGKEDGDDEPYGFYLIKASKACFNVVYSSENIGYEKTIADKLVNTLRTLGVNIDDPISDTSDEISECEIIIGTGASGRGDEFKISAERLGYEGYTVKSSGKRFIIAAGSNEYADIALMYFISEILGIGEDTEELLDVYISDDVFFEKLTVSEVSSVTISENDLSVYTLVFEIDGMGDFEKDNILNFSDALFKNTGYLLPIYKSGSRPEYSFVIRYANYAGDDGFRAFESEGDFVIECSYANAFDSAFKSFAENVLFTADDIELSKDYLYTDRVCDVYYRDFGAVGDGIADDYDALFAAHSYANSCGQTVYADEGDVYLLRERKNGSIPVMTNVYLGTAKIISAIGEGESELPIFEIKSVYDSIKYDVESDSEFFENLDLLKDQTHFIGISELLEEKSLVKIHGEKNGVALSDVFIIDISGKIDKNTLPVFNLSSVTGVEIYSLNDSDIVFSGGVFLLGKTVPVISVRRSNVKLDNLKYETNAGVGSVIPYIDFSLSYDCEIRESEVSVKLHDSMMMRLDKIGAETESAPFILMDGAKNVEINNSKLSYVDATLGVFGLEITKTETNSAVKLYGGGTFKADGLTVNDESCFIVLPRESGASFCGEIYIKDSKLIGKNSSFACVIKSEFDFYDYMDRKFGYDSYMPSAVYLDNFDFDGYDICIFSYIENIAFEEGKYRICERIIYENMNTLEITRNANADSILLTISVFNEAYPENF